MHEDRLINFAEYEWTVTHSLHAKQGPGPNFFAGDANTVSIENNALILSTKIVDEIPYSSQVVCTQALGYGTYTFKLNSRVDDLARNAVFSGFLYEDDANEIDIEFSSIMCGTGRGQYVVQPWFYVGHLKRIYLSDSIQTTHQIIWTPLGTTFKSWNGHSDTPTKEDTYAHWEYKKKYTMNPDKAVFIFNLWLYKGVKPQKEDSVTISSFTFSTTKAA